MISKYTYIKTVGHGLLGKKYLITDIRVFGILFYRRREELK